jgi:hypothetical protein
MPQLPSSAMQVLLILLVIVPGFVFQGVRIAHRGRLATDVDLSTRLIRAIATSAIFSLIYIVVLGHWLADTLRQTGPLIEHPRVGAAVALLGAFAIPAGAALLPAVVSQWNWLSHLRDWAKGWAADHKLWPALDYDPVPSAWDKIFQAGQPCFVKVLTSDGRWIAGYFGPASYATSYPEDRQVYVEALYDVDPDGKILQPIPSSGGAIIRCEDVPMVEFLKVSDRDTLESNAEGVDQP